MYNSENLYIEYLRYIALNLLRWNFLKNCNIFSVLKFIFKYNPKGKTNKFMTS